MLRRKLCCAGSPQAKNSVLSGGPLATAGTERCETSSVTLISANAVHITALRPVAVLGREGGDTESDTASQHLPVFLHSNQNKTFSLLFAEEYQV